MKYQLKLAGEKDNWVCDIEEDLNIISSTIDILGHYSSPIAYNSVPKFIIATNIIITTKDETAITKISSRSINVMQIVYFEKIEVEN